MLIAIATTVPTLGQNGLKASVYFKPIAIQPQTVPVSQERPRPCHFLFELPYGDISAVVGRLSPVLTQVSVGHGHRIAQVRGSCVAGDQHSSRHGLIGQTGGSRFAGSGFIETTAHGALCVTFRSRFPPTLENQLRAPQCSSRGCLTRPPGRLNRWRDAAKRIRHDLANAIWQRSINCSSDA